MSDVLALATLVGVCAAIVQLRQVRKQRRRQFEDMFVHRYWAIMDRLSLEAVESQPAEDGAVSREDRLAIMAYLRLSEDEVDLRAERWISKETWELWRAGIADQLGRWPFDVVWKDVRDREAAFADKGQYQQLRLAGDALLRAGWEPKASSSAWRLLLRGR